MSQHLKSLFLFAAMVAGMFLHEYLKLCAFLSPYLIFVMLFITYCRVSLSELHFSRLHMALLAFQTLVSVAVYFALLPFDVVLAQGVMICIFIPTANASPVIAGMLGGNVAVLATYLLLCNVCAAFLAPLYFGFMNGNGDFSFWDSVIYIFKRVFPLITGPFVLSVVVEKISKKLYAVARKMQSITFYLWNITLMLVVASATSFVMDEYRSGVLSAGDMVLYIAAALAVCAVQFCIGRRIGHHYGDPVVGGQGLGQKNTILAIWMVQAYLNPAASLIPAAYVFWQNLVNSFQIWRVRKG